MRGFTEELFEIFKVNVMRLRTVQLSDNDKYLWNEWVSSQPEAHFYHLWEWGNLISATYNYQRFYFVAKCDENIVGVLPLVLIKSRIFGNKLVSLPFCEYGGPLISYSAHTSIANAVVKLFSRVAIELTRKLGVDYLEMRHPSPSLPLSAFGFLPLERYLTFRVDLTHGEAEVWKNIDKKCRNAIRKATKSGVKIMAVDETRMEHYYDLYLNTQKRHGSPPHSAVLFTNIFNAFKEKGLQQLILAVYDGKAIGGVTVFCFNGKMYFWNNVSDRKYARLNSTNLLLWHVIQWGSRNNFKVFDLGRTRPQTNGIYHFKRDFGGKCFPLKDYILATKKVEPADPTQRKYVLLSKMWSRLPSTLAQLIGPSIVSEIGL